MKAFFKIRFVTISILEEFLGEIVGDFAMVGEEYFFKAKHVIKFVEEMNNTGKIIAAVCHGPAALVNAKNSDGLPLVKNRRINCFTDEEEREMNMHDVMPFLLESKLRACGGLFENAPPMKCHVAEDKNLITGQNPASAAKLAKILLSKLS